MNHCSVERHFWARKYWAGFRSSYNNNDNNNNNNNNHNDDVNQNNGIRDVEMLVLAAIRLKGSFTDCDAIKVDTRIGY